MYISGGRGSGSCDATAATSSRGSLPGSGSCAGMLKNNIYHSHMLVSYNIKQIHLGNSSVNKASGKVSWLH